MIRWGDFAGLQPALLQRAARVLAQQQAVAGANLTVPPMSAAASIMTHFAVKGLEQQTQHGPVVAHSGIGIAAWMLGYLYRCGEEGLLDAIIAELDSQSVSPGGAHDGEDVAASGDI